MTVGQVLDKMKVPFSRISLGEVDLETVPTQEFLAEFTKNITPYGFELIEDRNSRTISKVKSGVIDLVRGDTVSRKKKIKLSEYLADLMNKDYHSLSSLFSGVEGTTIEQYYILQKIEYVKELLAYDELSLSQIASKLQYSSVQHLSNQFKKVTGLTPSHFKAIGNSKGRRPLDKVG
jgi:AraC-like DNA-binding protein